MSRTWTLPLKELSSIGKTNWNTELIVRCGKADQSNMHWSPEEQ